MGLVVFHVIHSDEELVSCDAGIGEFYQTKNSCSSNNIYLNVDLNSSVRAEVAQCNIGEINSGRCAKPKTFILYDLLFIDRITSRFGYLSQCALEDLWPVNQDEVWTAAPIGPVEVYRSEDWGITATVNGSMLAYVPLCLSDFVEQPVKVNFTLDSLNQVGIEGIVCFPSVVGSMVGTVVLEYKVEGWWDYTWEEAFESSATFPLEVFASVFATEILLEHPSINGLTAIKSNAVSTKLDILELGEISDFSFSMEDSSFCDGSIFGMDFCPYIEDFLLSSFGVDLKELVLLYAEMGFADLQDELAVRVLNSTYTEIDFWGFNTACTVIQCDGLTLNQFVEKLHVVAWVHVVLSGMLCLVLCCVCGLWKWPKEIRNDTTLNSEIESNPLLYIESECDQESGKYGSVVHLESKSVA